ncbi:uncharacterized protein LOC111268324 [Varroa jacobsoni]|uniref:uncharacterized protein LOC111268324 n=1 Tax=Varroa jacobsoni TaxID=62625 RepID=UPI000BF67CC1|nr:uncharacterized protein LOC111268324 [Varroa jacobsoni]XP_022702965.1 uncharacterized protein LOC111268324 [Varroa jacobsoni]XP_022702966.1 uncharacterized protein LOC111268324 [Varroa jacobsoni]
MLASSVENKRAQCTGNGNCGELLKELCSQLNVPLPEDGFSAELIGVLFSSLTSIQIPKDLSPLELIRYVLRILSEEVVRAPLDHLDAKELLQGQPETVQDLLEILAACVHLRDNETSTIVSTMSSNSMASSGNRTPETSGESLVGLIHSFSSSSTSTSSSADSSLNRGGKRKNGLLTSSISCSSCDSISSDVSSFASSLSEPTQEVQLPCRLCQYLARFSFEPELIEPTAPIGGAQSDSAPTTTVPDNKSAAASTRQSPSKKIVSLTGPSCPAVSAKNLQVSNPIVKAKTSTAQVSRPSKILRSNYQSITKHGVKAATADGRHEMRQIAQAAKRKFDEEKKVLTTTAKPYNKTVKVFKKNVIIPNRQTTLRPVPMVPPDPAYSFSTFSAPTGCIDNNDVDNEESAVAESSEISPHLERVLRKQCSQHLQWMVSHGTSEAGLKKLEREYEDLLKRHTTRVKQIRKELCEQARLSALSTQKGVAASVRNIRKFARTQEQQLAHAQLEIERVERSKEARRRLAEERLLRETFTEAMRLQKSQLLDLNRELAEQRGRERDRHEIYMQGMEHFYRTQLNMLQDALEREARNGRMRTGAQIALLRDIRKELQLKLDEEMKNLREIASMDFDQPFSS